MISQAPVKTQKIKKSNLIKKTRNGQVDILIGTHALLQEGIEFKNLGLAIVDEQHRFGVEQRARLMANSQKKLQTVDSHNNSQTFASFSACTPHFLSMTATPIPRSLALTLYGDLDLSIIDELPRERKRIITKIVEPQDRPEAYQFIKEEVKKGRQVFVICPLIDPSDKLGVKSAKDEYEKLKKQIFPDLKIGLLHGRLKTKEKEKVRQEFLDNKINILVATSVIEVGVDIPNASVMMIEGAERFGLAQLYQFRGRVGRSKHQSYCFLFTETSSQKTQERLKAILTAKNCFELAEKDLEIRGPGEIYGVQQSGYLANLKIARLTDYSIIEKAKIWAKKILETDPDLKNHPALKEKLTDLEKPVHLE
jgi:ATP-dependent DNA helicase RecG